MFELSSDDSEKGDWKHILLIVELVMCAPQSNVVLERFFSQLNYIKTNALASLSSSSLNSLLHIKVTGLALQEYQWTCGEGCWVLVQCKKLTYAE